MCDRARPRGSGPGVVGGPGGGDLAHNGAHLGALGARFGGGAGEDDVVVEGEAEGRAQAEADDVGGDVVRQRRVLPQDLVGEEQAELGDEHPADIGEGEQQRLTGRVVPGAPPVGPQAVGDPREGRGDGGGQDVGGVGVTGEEAQRPVLEEVEQTGVDDEGQGPDQAEYYEIGRASCRERV